MRHLAIGLAVVAACSKADPAGSGSGAAPANADPRVALLATWMSGGMKPSEFAPLKGPAGGDCQSGAVDKVVVMLCTFPTAAAAKQAEDAGLAWVGDTTGMAQAHGTMLIAAADRAKADPNGRTINKLMKLAPK